MRFYDFLVNLRPDFWEIYFKNPDVIDAFTYASSLLNTQGVLSKYLRTNDIIGLDNAQPGALQAMQPVHLQLLTESSSNLDYPSVYKINTNEDSEAEADTDWVLIYAITDKLSDPAVQLIHKRDFYHVNRGYLNLTAEATARIGEDFYGYMLHANSTGTQFLFSFGALLGYGNMDSVSYRDTLQVLSAVHMLGPTEHNIKTGLNTVVDTVLQKYTDETVMTIHNGRLVTNKYNYHIGTTTTDYAVLDKIGTPTVPLRFPAMWAAPEQYQRFNPITNAVTIYTDNTAEAWWATLDRKVRCLSN